MGERLLTASYRTPFVVDSIAPIPVANYSIRSAVGPFVALGPLQFELDTAFGRSAPTRRLAFGRDLDGRPGGRRRRYRFVAGFDGERMVTLEGVGDGAEIHWIAADGIEAFVGPEVQTRASRRIPRVGPAG